MVEPMRPAPESDWDLTRNREQRELETLRRRVEALESAPKEEPWWRNPKAVTVLVSVVAALVPLTTAVDAYLKGRTNLALASAQQRHAMRMDYMRTALDPQAPELQRQSRLRLLTFILESDDPVRTWAESELGVVNQTIDQLKDNLEQTEHQLDKAQQQELAAKENLTALETKLKNAQPPSPSAPSEAPVLEREVQEARQELDKVSQQKATLSTRAAKTSEKLGTKQPARSAPGVDAWK
jgi:chromosome segregation ATPase